MAQIKLTELIPPVQELDRSKIKSIFGGMNKQELVTSTNTFFTTYNYCDSIAEEFITTDTKLLRW